MKPIQKKVFAGEEMNLNQKQTCLKCQTEWYPKLEDHECDKGLSVVEGKLIKLRRMVSKQLCRGDFHEFSTEETLNFLHSLREVIDE